MANNFVITGDAYSLCGICTQSVQHAPERPRGIWEATVSVALTTVVGPCLSQGGGKVYLCLIDEGVGV